MTLPDPKALERLVVLGGSSLVQEVAELFLEHGQVRVEQIRGGWDDGDLERLAGAAHSLRTSAANLGLLPLAELCAELEAAAHEDDLPATGIAMVRLDAEFTRSRAAVQALLG